MFIIRDVHAKFGISNLPQSPDIGKKSDGGISNFWISGQSLIKRNCHNSCTTDDIDMKLNLTRWTKQRQKILMMTLCWKIATSLPFFEFRANLEQSGSWIPDTQSVKLISSLIVAFYLTKTENRTKKSLTQPSHYCL